MKKILFIAFTSFIINAKAQILFEHKYDSASAFLYGTPAVAGQLMIINFEVSGPQYVNINRWGKYISIYDLNHSLIKTISLSGVPLNGSIIGDVLYLSEHLFNTDSKIEFMYAYSGANDYTGIYNEDGILLFSDTGVAAVHVNYPQQQFPIYNTPNGTKMILSYRSTTSSVSQANMVAKVFGLPGILTTAIHVANQNLMQASGLISNPHPNPTNNTTNVEYKLPDGIHQGEIVFYDVQGIEVKRFKVDKTFNSLLISTTDIPAGTYYYQLQTSGNVSAGKKMVVVK